VRTTVLTSAGSPDNTGEAAVDARLAGRNQVGPCLFFGPAVEGNCASFSGGLARSLQAAWLSTKFAGEKLPFPIFNSCAYANIPLSMAIQA
jgi:hypothetical protein